MEIIVAALGIMCISRFVAGPEYAGPWDLLHRFRHRVGLRYDEYSNLYGKNVVAQGLSCPVCAPIWIGSLVAPFLFFFPGITAVALFPFAVSEVMWRLDYGH